MIADRAGLRERPHCRFYALEDFVKSFLVNVDIGADFALALIRHEIVPCLRETLEVIAHDAFDDDTKQRNREKRSREKCVYELVSEGQPESHKDDGLL